MARAAATDRRIMSGRATPVARLENVSHRYGATCALNAVTLDVPGGRTVGLIGPDGVGKSSLLGIIAGARHIQTGQVRCSTETWRMLAIATKSAPASPTCPRGSARTSIPI